jgi:hypothetical protein
MKMRIAFALAAIAAPLVARHGTAQVPAGWSARTDKDAPMTDVKIAPMGAGIHVTTGPAVILWRDADAVSGGLHTVATFTQTKATEHPEAYGIFIAGKDLKGAGQSYTYFLVRQDGKFLIKAREGANTKNVTTGWTDSEAVAKADASGKTTNKLEIAVGTDRVSFRAKGKEVYSMTAAAGSVAGIVGLRVNHGLDVHIDGFAVHKM